MLDRRGECEIIVVDGHRDRDTITAIRDPDVIGMGSARGRGRQMNAGAAVARGSILLFLHADTYLPPDGLAGITSVMKDARLVGGAFDLSFDSPRAGIRLLARVDSLRARLSRIPFGDQAIFLRRDYFKQIGGFARIPIMEDVEIMRRIKRRRDPIAFLAARVTTSARRLLHEGLVYCVARGGAFLLLFYLGVSPFRLKRVYKDGFRPRRAGVPHPPRRAGETPCHAGLAAGDERQAG